MVFTTGAGSLGVVKRLLLIVAASSWLALPAVAQTVSEIATEVDFRGYYLDGEAEISIADLEGLVDRFPRVGFVALGPTPSGGADLLADRVLETSPTRDTVIVLTRDEAGAASAVYEDPALDAAFDAAFATTGDSYLRDFEQVAGALTGPGGAVDPPPSRPGGLSFWWWLVIAGVGVLIYRMWRNSRADEDAVGRRLAEARGEIESQMAVVANQIIELSDRVELASDREATAHYRRASDVFRSAEDRLAEASTAAALESLADDLNDARWELAAAEALVEGRPVPDRPAEEPPEPCFFDPTHGAGVEEAELSTAAGTRTVKVCRRDADRLRSGEHPEPREVTVDGRAMPAPAAPRSHGGRGMDALDVFSILVGGMGNPTGYRWQGTRRRGTSGFPGLPGGFGAGAGGTRTRSTASAARAAGAVARSIGRARRGR
jgi:hypothetical protein